VRKTAARATHPSSHHLFIRRTLLLHFYIGNQLYRMDSNATLASCHTLDIIGRTSFPFINFSFSKNCWKSVIFANVHSCVSSQPPDPIILSATLPAPPISFPFQHSHPTPRFFLSFFLSSLLFQNHNLSLSFLENCLS